MYIIPTYTYLYNFIIISIELMINNLPGTFKLLIKKLKNIINTFGYKEYKY